MICNFYLLLLPGGLGPCAHRRLHLTCDMSHVRMTAAIRPGRGRHPLGSTTRSSELRMPRHASGMMPRSACARCTSLARQLASCHWQWQPPRFLPESRGTTRRVSPGIWGSLPQMPKSATHERLMMSPQQAGPKCPTSPRSGRGKATVGPPPGRPELRAEGSKKERKIESSNINDKVTEVTDEPLSSRGTTEEKRKSFLLLSRGGSGGGVAPRAFQTLSEPATSRTPRGGPSRGAAEGGGWGAGAGGCRWWGRCRGPGGAWRTGACR